MAKFNLFARMQTKSKIIISLFALTIVIIFFSTPILAQSNSESKPKDQTQTISPTTPQPQKSIWPFRCMFLIFIQGQEKNRE